MFCGVTCDWISRALSQGDLQDVLRDGSYRLMWFPANPNDRLLAILELFSGGQLSDTLDYKGVRSVSEDLPETTKAQFKHGRYCPPTE